MDALAAAYAERGLFPNAIKQAEKAIELARADKKDDLRKRLEQYRANTPYREAVNFKEP